MMRKELIVNEEKYREAKQLFEKEEITESEYKEMVSAVTVAFKASATVPRLYRMVFGKDIFYDMQILQKDFAEKAETDSDITIESLEIFENVAYIMAKHADPEGVPSSPELWLERFDMFDIYMILPQLFELWNLNVQSKIESKKKLQQVAGK